MGFEILELEEIILKNVADRRRMRQLYCLHKYIDRSSLSLQFLANKLSHDALSYCCTATTGIPSLWRRACHYYCHPVIQPFYPENSLVIVNMSNGESVASFATDYPLLILSNGFSVAVKLATDLSVAKKSAMTNLHPIFAVADFVAKLF
jgi:hypothetical protein